MNFLLGSDAIADTKTVKEMKFRCPNNRYSVASLLTNLLTQTTKKGQRFLLPLFRGLSEKVEKIRNFKTGRRGAVPYG